MMKIYTNEPKTSNELQKSPKKAVVDNVLNFSKSLEVLKLEEQKKEELNKVEVILN